MPKRALLVDMYILPHYLPTSMQCAHEQTMVNYWIQILLQVQGVVQDSNGRTVATLFGKWDESVHYVLGECSGKGKASETMSEAHLLWKRSKPSQFPTRYNLTRFAITLNELTVGLKVFNVCCVFFCEDYNLFQWKPFSLNLYFIHKHRKICHQLIQGWGPIRGAWRMGNMKRPMQRSCGWSRGSDR